MANVFDQFDEDPVAPTAKAVPKAVAANPFDVFDEPAPQPISPTRDYAQQILHGLGRGIAAIPALPGDIGALMGAGIDWATGASPQAQQQAQEIAGGGILPTSRETIGFAERNLIGERPQAQSKGAEFAGNVAQYVPGGMMAGPGGVLGRAALGAATGAASEGAREMGLPGWAQFAAGMAPGMLTGLARSVSSPASKVVQRAVSETPDRTWRQAERLFQQGKDVGVPLMPSEALAPNVGGGPISQLAADVRATPAGGPIMSPVFEQRPTRITKSATSAIRAIGPKAKPDDILKEARKVAETAIKDLERKRVKGTENWYALADEIDIPPNTIDPIIARVNEKMDKFSVGSEIHNKLAATRRQLRGQPPEDSSMQAVYDQALREAMGEPPPVRKPETNSARLSGIYKDLKASIKPAVGPSAEGPLRRYAGTLGPIADDIQQTLVANNQTFATAEDLYKRLSKPVEAMAGTKDAPSIVTRIMDAKDMNELRSLMLSPDNVDPATVQQLAGLFKSQGKEDVLRSWFRAYLGRELNQASKRLQTGKNPSMGANFVTRVYGTDDQKAIMNAYLREVDQTGAAERGFRNLVEVLERTAKTPGMGSTATRLQTADQLGGGVGPAMAGLAGTAALAGTGVETVGFAGAYLGANAVQRAINKAYLNMGSKKIAKALTDPDGLKKLRALAKKDPRSPAAASSVLAILGGNGGEDKD